MSILKYSFPEWKYIYTKGTSTPERRVEVGSTYFHIWAHQHLKDGCGWKYIYIYINVYIYIYMYPIYLNIYSYKI
jgi:hypothetical protein